MEIYEYERLTGKDIDTPDQFQPLLNRVQSKLETLLGYTLSPSNLYTELGKTKTECSCLEIPEPNDLLPATPTRGSIKVFPYNAKDRKLRVDPFYEVYAVKLVKVVSKGRFVTVKDFDNFNPEYGANGIGNYIAKCTDCGCDCGCKNCVQLAVAADWVDFAEDGDSVPTELLWLLAEMADFYADPGREVKSESVDGHSWTRGDVVAPENRPEVKLLLKKYAGPYGSITRIPVV